MIARRVRCQIVVICLVVAGVASCAAQAGPPCGPDLPIKCNPGKGAAIVLGFVGAGALAAYLGYRIDHPKNITSVAGCTTLQGGEMTLTASSTQAVYLLEHAGKKVKPGEQVVLKGSIKRNSTNRSVLRVKKVVEDLGPCQSPSSEPSGPAAGS